MGVAFADAESKPEFGGFVDLCILQIMDQRIFTGKDLANMLGVSDDWVLKNFKDVKGKFHKGTDL